MTAPGAPDVREFGGCKVITTPIAPMDAIDLVPELLATLAPGGAMATFDGEGETATVVRDGQVIGDAIGMMARALIGGRLTKLLPKIMAGSTVVIPGPGGGKFDLTSLEKINAALTLRPDLLLPLVWTGLEVQFSRFFPGFALLGLKLPIPSRSADSSQSTTATGSSTD